MFWAVKVQLRPHLCDIWAFGLTGIAILMAVHQAAYSALGPRLELFNVRGCISIYLHVCHTSQLTAPKHPQTQKHT